MKHALTSLLEELPEVNGTTFSMPAFTFGQKAYREKIKSLIQNKLK